MSCVAVSVSALKSSTWSERRRNCAHHFGQLSRRATIARRAIVARITNSWSHILRDWVHKFVNSFLCSMLNTWYCCGCCESELPYNNLQGIPKRQLEDPRITRNYRVSGPPVSERSAVFYCLQVLWVFGIACPCSPVVWSLGHHVQ